MKTIMISIKPEFVAKILNGEKTIEIRKKFPKYYVGWVYIYCTKDTPLKQCEHFRILGMKCANKGYYLNGKVVAKFTLNKVEEITNNRLSVLLRLDKLNYIEPPEYKTKSMFQEELLEKSCLTEQELNAYLDVEKGYAWHIDKLDVFHEPRELSSFLVKSHKVSGVDREGKEKTFTILKPIVRAPQSWCYIEIGE